MMSALSVLICVRHTRFSVDHRFAGMEERVAFPDECPCLFFSYVGVLQPAEFELCIFAVSSVMAVRVFMHKR